MLSGSATPVPIDGGKTGAVLILTGPPGAGKTTVADLVARQWPRAVHLEGDTFWLSIVSGLVAPWTPEAHQQNAVVHGAVTAAAICYAKAGYLTVIDMVVDPAIFLDPLTKSLQAAGLDVSCAILQAPLGTVLERAKNRTNRPLADEGAVEHMWRVFEDLVTVGRHAVSVQGKSPSALAHEIGSMLSSGKLRV